MSRAMTRSVRLVAPLLLGLALVACGGGGEHASDEGHASSSAGLPTGRVSEGEALANAKGKATGQSCIDCHGADGNNPLDDSYPKLGGQYYDYLEHALMGPQAKDLTDKQIADVASYFASQPTKLTDLSHL